MAKKTILIVEDEQMLLRALTDKLTHTGFNVLQAVNGQEGLEAAKGQHPDLILLDIVMPVMDGLTMLEKMLSDENAKKIPVIILTNLAGTDTILKAKELGNYSYLIKTDWTLDEVVKKIWDKLGQSVTIKS